MTEDGQPQLSLAWFRSKYKANISVLPLTSFGVYVASLNHKDTIEVEIEFNS